VFPNLFYSTPPLYIFKNLMTELSKKVYLSQPRTLDIGDDMVHHLAFDSIPANTIVSHDEIIQMGHKVIERERLSNHHENPTTFHASVPLILPSVQELFMPVSSFLWKTHFRSFLMTFKRILRSKRNCSVTICKVSIESVWFYKSSS